MTDPLSSALLGLTGATVALALVALAARWPRQASLLLVPVLTLPVVLTVAGVPVPYLAPVLVLAGVVLSGRHRPPTRLTWAGGLFSLLVVASLLAHGPSRAMEPSMARNSALAVVVCVMVLLVFAGTRPSTDSVLRWAACSLAASAVLLVTIGEQTGGRLVAESVNSNAAGYTGAAGVLCVLLCGARSSRRAAWAVLLLPTGYLLYLSQSRGALTALVAGLVAWVAVSVQGRLRIVVLTLGLAVSVLLWAPATQFASDVLLAQRSAAFVESDSRVTLLRLGLETVAASPLGIGYGHFLDVSAPYFGFPLNTHNEWLRITVEMGVVAGALAVYLVPARALVRGDVRLRALVVLGTTALVFSNALTDLRVSFPLLMAAGLLWTGRRPRTPDPALRDDRPARARPPAGHPVRTT